MDGEINWVDAFALAGGTAFIIGYLITNQVWLRVVQMFGSGFYIWYYVSVAETPLWTPLFMSAAMGVANLWGLSLLLLRRSRLILSREERELFDMFHNLTPGDFKMIRKKAERVTLPRGEVLCETRQPVVNVHFVISGEPVARKSSHTFRMTEGIFIGEVAFILGQTSSATVTLPEGGEVLRWPVATLKLAARWSPRFKLAFEAAIAHDMAAKVALAVAPDTFQVSGTSG